MVKQDLIDHVAFALASTKVHAAEAVAAVLGGVQKGLVDGGSAELKGFGTFIVKPRAARTGRNPATGQEIPIPASYAIGFRPSKALKEAVN